MNNVIPISAAKPEPAPKEQKRASRKRRKTTKTIQWFVDCTDGLKDLKGLPGVLTVDYRGDDAWEATFDPDDESIDNAVIPIETLTMSNESITLTSEDDDAWSFGVASDPYYPTDEEQG